MRKGGNEEMYVPEGHGASSLKEAVGAVEEISA